MSLAEPITKEEWQKVDHMFVKLPAYPARAGQSMFRSNMKEVERLSSL